MKGFRILLIICILSMCVFGSCKDFPTLDHLRTSVSTQEQTTAVGLLAQRLLGNRSSEFVLQVHADFDVDKRDSFKIWSSHGKVYVAGSTAVATASGLHHYLKHYCDAHISWGGQQMALPSPLPDVGRPQTMRFNDKLRYFANVCTPSYSFVWWSWNDWQQLIDWLALSGYNLPLAFNAQEAIWRRVYLKMGFTQAELDDHFAGPAFLAWQRMGNMHGFGGPLPPEWSIQQLSLQHLILRRMRSLGMLPVLPAFAGHVPSAISRVFPGHQVTHLRDWGRFNATYCCTSLLNLTDPLFTVIGRAFLTEYIKEFGTNHIYSADTFNEMTPHSSSPIYLKQAGHAVFKAMLAADSQSIWLMQGWLFLDIDFWKPEQAKALLTAVPQGRMIVLDLAAEMDAQYSRLQSFYGQPFIWCMLHNYGGTLGLFGSMDEVSTGVYTARDFPNSSLVGTGLTMEGINQNDVIYEFMNENILRSQPSNITQWISHYAKSRYGVYNSNADKAWQLLKKSVYNCTISMEHHNKVLLVRRPSNKAHFDRIWYNPQDVFKAWDYMLDAANTLHASSLFRYDLVDVTRQSLQLITAKFYSHLLYFHKARQLSNMTMAGEHLLDLMSWLDKILASDDHFLLGDWLETAKRLATNENDRRLYEYNARNQITIWGPHANILDYANKQWAGLVVSYYRPRWKLFISQLRQSLIQGTSFNETQFKIDVFKYVEEPFTFRRDSYPSTPMGDSVSLSHSIHAIFRPFTEGVHEHFFQSLPKLSMKGSHFHVLNNIDFTLSTH